MHSPNLLSLSVLALSLSASASAYHLQARQTTAASTDFPSTTTAASAAATSTIDGTAENHFIESVCYPTNSSGDPYEDAPCYQAGAISETCAYGPNNTSDNPVELSATEQQKCFCQGPFWQYFSGCMECERLHGAPLSGPDSGWEPVQSISALSSSYCGAAPATQAWDDFVSIWSPTTSIAIGTSTGGVDVLGTSTDVSLYFTLTGTGATTATSTASSQGTGVTTATTTASGKSTGSTGVATSAAAKDSASGSVTGTATGSVSAVSKSAATGLQVSGIWATGLLAAAILL